MSDHQIVLAFVLLSFIASAFALPESPPQNSLYFDGVPGVLQGPFFFDPPLMTELDCETCQKRGPLNFKVLTSAKLTSGTQAQRIQVFKSDSSNECALTTEPTIMSASLAKNANPFTFPQMSQIKEIVECELQRAKETAKIWLKNSENNVDRLSDKFLIDPGSTVELTGVVNRMDRQFIKDTGLELSPEQLKCGEVSLIYRFAYKIRRGASRLPVTLNLVFPAVPSVKENLPAVTCKDIAERWRKAMDPTQARTAAVLTDPTNGPLGLIQGRDILRIELNMQTFRLKASQDGNGFGSQAGYLIRVFRWAEGLDQFIPGFITNQIDRAKLLCAAGMSKCKCIDNDRRLGELVEYLSRPAVVASADAGTLNIPQDLGVLAERAESISPGGPHRSANQPYWNAPSGADKSIKYRDGKVVSAPEQIISDQELQEAINRALKAGESLSFIKSPLDFRTRLNDSTCTGCHQTRAIAGFHFPGADRANTRPENAVLLPGSPFFYGDQPRRMEILNKIADGKSLTQAELAISYSARPLNKYRRKFAGEGYDLRLMSVAATDGLVNEGRNLVVVALVGSDLTIRIFDASGKKVVDKGENELVSGEMLRAFKERLNTIPRKSTLSIEDKKRIIEDATSIAGHNPPEPKVHLIGGWGTYCLNTAVMARSQRKWPCQDGYSCFDLLRLADSTGRTLASDLGLGMCLKSGWAEPANRVVGDPLQRGFVLTKAFGRDQYVREEPKPSTPRDTRIPRDSLPPEAPEGNGFFGAHQEYFDKCKDRRRDKKGPPCQQAGGNSHADIRDDITGGFPGGALRLNECTNLPGEATCGLVASSGFNECLGGVRRGGDLNIAHCFDLFTAFAGMRACNAANPCRDDYICAMPIAQSRQCAEALYAERAAKLKDSKNRELYEKLATREYDSKFFGEKKPDENWLKRNDKRGICIPPYFVFQFRTDGHPYPD